MLSLGDSVLVKNVSIRGKHKIADLWEHTPYAVISQPNPDVPVYEVKHTSNRVKKTRLRIVLLPFMGLPSMEQTDEVETGTDLSEGEGQNSTILDGYSSSSSSSFGSYELRSGRSDASDDESSISEADMNDSHFFSELNHTLQTKRQHGQRGPEDSRLG